MTNIVAIVASPVSPSRSRFLLQSFATLLKSDSVAVREIVLHSLPAEQLLSPTARGDEVASAISLIERANAEIIATRFTSNVAKPTRTR